MKKGSTVVRWTKADDATIAKMRGKGATWEEVAAAVSTRRCKRSAEATMQRSRYTAGKQKKAKPATSKPTVVRGRHASSAPSMQSILRPVQGRSVKVGGQTFSLPKL